jgi:outer membrane protein assembly factor BamB
MWHVRERPGTPGVLVSAVDLRDHEPIWQTWLAAPLVGEPLADPKSGSLVAVTASGGMFRFQASALEGKGTGPIPATPAKRGPPEGRSGELDLSPSFSATTDQPVLAIEAGKIPQGVRTLTPLADGMFAMTTGPGSSPIVLYDPREQEKRFRWLLSPEPMAAPPLGLAGGILVASQSGGVFLLDPQSMGNMAKPIRHDLPGGTAWKWLAPQAADGKQALLCDGDRRLCLVRFETQPEARLIEAATATTSKPVVSPVAALGNTAFVVEGASLVPLALPGLTEGKPQPLEGPCTWGPVRAGQHVLLATEKGYLHCYGTDGQEVWQQPLGCNAFVGTPLAADGFIYLAASGGSVWRIDAESGKVAGRIDVGCPLGTGPVILGDRLFIGSQDGCLLEIKQ